MDRSEDAAFPKLGVGAVVPAPGNDGNCLLSYKWKDKRPRERQKTVPFEEHIQIFQCDLMSFKGTFFCGNVIVSLCYPLALQTVFLTFIQSVDSTGGDT